MSDPFNGTDADPQPQGSMPSAEGAPPRATIDDIWEEARDRKCAPGKWGDPNVPKREWSCLRKYPLEGDERITCEMCEYAQIKYVHVMVHDEYPDALHCGCDCSGWMQGDLNAAYERDKALKSEAGKALRQKIKAQRDQEKAARELEERERKREEHRRQQEEYLQLAIQREQERLERERQEAEHRRVTWLNREWRRSAAGNEYLKVAGHHMVIFRKGQYWGARVENPDKEECFSKKKYRTSDAAKLACHDVVFGLLKNGRPQNLNP